MKRNIKQLLALLIALMLAMPTFAFAEEPSDGIVEMDDFDEESAVASVDVEPPAEEANEVLLDDLIAEDALPSDDPASQEEAGAEASELTAAIDGAAFSVTGMFPEGAALKVSKVEDEAIARAVEAAVGEAGVYTHRLYRVEVADSENGVMLPDPEQNAPVVRAEGLDLPAGTRVALYDEAVQGAYEIDAQVKDGGNAIVFELADAALLDIFSVEPEEDASEEPASQELPEDASEEPSEPAAFEQSRTVDGVAVTVKAEPGVFPENAQLIVERVPASRQADQAIGEVRDGDVNVAVSYTFDIKVIDPETQEELQPAEGRSVSVSFSLEEAANENLTANVYHFAEDGVEKLDVTREDAMTATVETENFSVYALELTYDDPEYALPEPLVVEEEEIFSSEEDRDRDALLDGYIQRMIDAPLGRSDEIMPKARPAGASLTGADRAMYDILKPVIAQIAAGAIQSTEISITDQTLAEYGITWGPWTAEELGVDAIVIGNNINEAATAAAKAKMGLDFGRVMDALLSDFPYELYWYNKANKEVAPGGASTTFQYGAASDDKGNSVYLTISNFKVLLSVAQDYAVVAQDNTVSRYEVDSTKINMANNAVANAQKIVNSASGTVMERLAYFKEQICALTAYNKDAADNKDTTSSVNPWQLVWVFDGDDSTNVVCEGYSKAFKYLFDLANFGDGYDCLLVTGDMDGGTGAGGHMWNIVQMDDGRNYLVDVTNCDEGTIGAPDKLFMAYGPSEVQTNGYTLSWSDGSGSSSIIYTYDSNTIATFGEARLTLSNTAYGVDPVAIIDSASVVFDGKIRLKYYYIIPSELLDSGAEIKFTCPNEPDVSIPLNKGTAESDGSRSFCYDVVAEEIRAPIMARILDAKGEPVTVKSKEGTDYTDGFEYSVQQYAQNMQEKGSEKMKPLAKALEDYGIAAKIYFKNGDTSGLAVSSDVTEVLEADLTPFALTTSGQRPSGITGCSISAMFESDNSLRIYYRFDDPTKSGNYTYTVDGSSASLTKRKDGALYLTVKGIAAKYLSEPHTFTISDGTDTYTVKASALSYAMTCIQKGEEANQNLGKALYRYYQAADSYFKNN